MTTVKFIFPNVEGILEEILTEVGEKDPILFYSAVVSAIPAFNDTIGTEAPGSLKNSVRIKSIDFKGEDVIDVAITMPAEGHFVFEGTGLQSIAKTSKHPAEWVIQPGPEHWALAQPSLGAYPANIRMYATVSGQTPNPAFEHAIKNFAMAFFEHYEEELIRKIVGIAPVHTMVIVK